MTDSPPEDRVVLKEKRERTVEALTKHYADSVIGITEFERRVDLAERADSVTSLDELMADLQGTPEQRALVPARPVAMVPADSVPEDRTMVAVLGGATRKGVWAVPRKLRAVAVLGGIELDFREAQLGPGVTELTIVTVLGGAELLVPPWLPVDVNGFGFLGGWDDHTSGPQGAEGTGVPMLRIRGVAVLGGVEVHERLPGESRRQARKRRREERKRLAAMPPRQLAPADPRHRALDPAVAPESSRPRAAEAPTLPSAGTPPDPGAATRSPHDYDRAPASAGPIPFVPVSPELPASSSFAGRYEIRSILGRGGMGSVYLARDRQLDDDVAIKIAHVQLEANAVLLDRLRREVAAGRRIAHENVIRVHDLGEYAGRLFISMEHFAGEPLSELVARDGPTAPEQTRAIALQVTAALAAAHAADVIHRDLKPQNILIDSAGHVKVIDFGLALAPHLQGLTATGLIMGTPEYMAPEQIRGDDVDARTDLYALGCVVYYLLAASPPFVADTPIAVGFAHLRKEHTPPSRSRPDLGPKWDALCARLLAKRKEDRFPNAGQVREHLEQIG